MAYPRNLAAPLLDACRDSPVVLLNGARQTGKSTLVQTLFPGAAEAVPVYLSFDDLTLLAAAKAAPQDFVDGLPCPVILDEIQRVPELFLPLKRAVDRDRRPGRFILTGSANVLALPRLADSLAGRMEVLTLWPLSQGELRSRRENGVDLLFGDALPAAGPSLSAQAWADLLTAGGYPEAVQRSDPRRRDAWFRSYLTTLLQRDVAALSRVEGLTAFPDLLSLLATRTGALLNRSDLSRSVGLSDSSMRRYLTLLEMVFLTLPLPAWSANLGKRLVKAPKLYLNDAGLLCHLLGCDREALLTDRKQLGMVLESFVILEVWKQLGWSEKLARPYHFRTQAGQEVDLVLEAQNGRLVGLEIKAGTSVSDKAFAGLRLLAEATGERFHRGVVLYTGAQTVAFGDRLHALPVSLLWQT